MTINRDFFKRAQVSILIKKLFSEFSDQLDGTLGVEGVTASADEINVLDGATNANDTTGKAAILGTSGAMTLAGSLTIGAEAISESDAAVLNSIPTADQNDSETIWNDGGVLKVSSAP